MAEQDTGLHAARLATYCYISRRPSVTNYYFAADSSMRLDTPRISICQFSTFRWSLSQDVLRYSSHGINSIGIWRRKLNDYGLSDAADLIQDNKMSVSSLHWAGGFTGDGSTFPQAIEDAIQAIREASLLNAECLILHPGTRNGHTIPHATRLIHAALQELVPIAADYGVLLGLEPIPTNRISPWTFLASFEDTVSILERYDSQSVGLVLDLFHVGFDSSVFEQLESLAHRIALVQLADRSMKDFESDRFQQKNETHRRPLGNGNIQFTHWLKRLQEVGYAGQFEVELHGADVDHNDYFSLLDSVSDYFGSSPIAQLMEPQSQRQQLRQQ